MAKLKEGVRAQKAASTLNVGVSSLLEYLEKKGVSELNQNSKLDRAHLEILREQWPDVEIVAKAEPKTEPKPAPKAKASSSAPKKAVAKAKEAPAPKPTEEIPTEAPTLKVKTVGKIELKEEKPKAKKRTTAKKEEEVPEAKPAVKKKTTPKAAATPPVQKDEKKEEPVPEPAVPEVKVEVPAPEETILTDTEKLIKEKAPGPKVLGKIELDEKPKAKKRTTKKAEETAPVAEPPSPEPVPEPAPSPETEGRKPKPIPVASASPDEPEIFRTGVEKLAGPTVVGKIDLSAVEDRRGRKPEASATPSGDVSKRRRRQRLETGDAVNSHQRERSGDRRGEENRARRAAKSPRRMEERPEISKEDIDEKIKAARLRMQSKRDALTQRAKYRKEKRTQAAIRREEELERIEQESRIIQVTEFMSVNELASIMDVPVNEVMVACMNMGVMVAMNMRLEAETVELLVEEFGFQPEFVDANVEVADEAEDAPGDLVARPPVFTILGHVDHGKTTLCDTIRKTHVTAAEAGGITQHMSAYTFTTGAGRQMTLIDTPGHEAFTAMRSRGAKLTDVAIIVVSAADGLQDQTREAMNHVMNSGARIVFAINKIDKPGADPERVKKELAEANFLVEDWGGKYQSQEISAKFNQNIDLLLEKVLLEADLLELKANPGRRAEGTVIESMLDKGRGHVVCVLVQSGTLRKGDSIVAGGYYGRVKSLFATEGGGQIKEAGPSTPVMVVGLNGAPQAGDAFNAVASDKEARTIASKLSSIRREVEMRARRPLSIEEMGRRAQLGNFQQVNFIVRADVDGSVETVKNMLTALSTDEMQISVVQGGVGQISETDVDLAKSTDSIIIGFNTRPSIAARRLAEKLEIEILTYSIIYKLIDEVKAALEGMLIADVKEEVLGVAEVRETFHISKVGTVAGCMVTDGKITKGKRIHVIREGIVVYTSELLSLKRFKDEVKEVSLGQDCGMAVKGFNDVKVGDLIECFHEVEVRRTLD